MCVGRECDSSGSEGFAVDHDSFGRILAKTDCSRPIVLRLRRILRGSTGTDIEASVRLDFFALHQGTTPTAMAAAAPSSLRPLPFKIMDSTFTHPSSFRNLFENESCRLDELLSQRNLFYDHHHQQHQESEQQLPCPTTDFEYDAALSRELVAAEQRSRALRWNIYTRLAMETLNLKQLIAARIKSLSGAWVAQRSGGSSSGAATTFADGPDPALKPPSSEKSTLQSRASYLLNQLIARELPAAAADASRKLPISSHIAFYERPSITMKAVRAAGLGGSLSTSNGGGAVLSTASNSAVPSSHHPLGGGGRKRKGSSNSAGSSSGASGCGGSGGGGKTILGSSKGLPRPILPANNRSRTPSMETITDHVPLSTSDEHVAVAALLSPAPLPTAASISDSLLLTLPPRPLKATDEASSPDHHHDE